MQLLYMHKLPLLSPLLSLSRAMHFVLESRRLFSRSIQRRRFFFVVFSAVLFTMKVHECRIRALKFFAFDVVSTILHNWKFVRNSYCVLFFMNEIVKLPRCLSRFPFCVRWSLSFGGRNERAKLQRSCTKGRRRGEKCILAVKLFTIFGVFLRCFCSFSHIEFHYIAARCA